MKVAKRAEKILLTKRKEFVTPLAPPIDNDIHKSETYLSVAEGILITPKTPDYLADDLFEGKDLPNVPLQVILKALREERDEDWG